MFDSIEYELVNWKPREVWHCDVCKRYRHRDAIKGLLPAVCCGQPAKLVDRYEEPREVFVSKCVGVSESWPPKPLPIVRDEMLELVMAQMQSGALEG